MEEGDKKRLRKLIRETLSNDTIADMETSDLRPWLYYYKNFSDIGYNSMGLIYAILGDSSLNEEGKLRAIVGLYRKYLLELHTLQTPSLNQ